MEIADSPHQPSASLLGQGLVRNLAGKDAHIIDLSHLQIQMVPDRKASENPGLKPSWPVLVALGGRKGSCKEGKP